MKTTNYSIFKIMNINRDILEFRIKRVIESIMEIGYIESRPIIVDKDLFIIDGQARFEACKKLKLPIIYEIYNGDSKKAMIALNSFQQVWTQKDFVYSWAKQGKESYIKLVEYEEHYKFGISNSIAICMPKTAADNGRMIKKGDEFEINIKRYDIADFLLEAKIYLNFWKKHHFVQSIVKLHKLTTKENCDKIQSKLLIITEQPTVNHYLMVYENILNKHKKNPDNIVALLTR